jgi:N-acetylmuramoyl-L-alanine amidase
VQPSPHLGRLKAQIVQAAVQDNADAIADRLPPPLRPFRRFLAVWPRRVGLLMFPASMVAVLALVTHRTTAQPLPAAQPTPDQPAVAVNVTAAPARGLLLDASMLTRPLRPRALALGVRRVVLDPGHGGAHLGTMSASGLLEKVIALDLAERTKRLLVDRGFEVVMTRAGDETLSLKERSATANRNRGDIFVSIHLNSFEPGGLRGIETYYLGASARPEHDALAAAENQHSGYSLADMRTLLDSIYADARRDESKRLAQSVQKAIVTRLRTMDHAITDRGVRTAPFVVLVGTDMPAILAEVSCLSNAEEAKQLGATAYRQSIAEALVVGIQSYVDPNVTPNGERKDRNER